MILVNLNISAIHNFVAGIFEAKKCDNNGVSFISISKKKNGRREQSSLNDCSF